MLHSIFAALVLALPAAAASDPKAVVETIFSGAAKQSVAKNTQLQEEINRNIDFSQMARQALGQAAASRSPAELAWFDTTLKEIITRTVYPEAPRFLNAVKISYRDVKLDGGKAKVASVVRQKGESTDVDYSLRETPEGWRVVDVAIDGESWGETISEQVRKTLEKRSWAGLKEKLSKRLASLKAGKKTSAKDDKDL